MYVDTHVDSRFHLHLRSRLDLHAHAHLHYYLNFEITELLLLGLIPVLAQVYIYI